MRYIDSHTHIYLRGPEDLKSMSAAGIEGVVVCSYFPVKPTGASTLIDLHRWIEEVELPRLKSFGIVGKVALGMHPRSIPDSDVDAVLDQLSSAFSSGAVAALGEVGLDAGTKEEEDVLRSQIRLAKGFDLPMIFHTPRQNKDKVFHQLLRIIQDERVDSDKIIVDHLTAEQMPLIREIGANAGITVQSGKLTEKDAADIVNSFGPENIMINSDLGNMVSDPLTVPKVAEFMIREGLGSGDVEKVVYKNIKRALKF